MQQSLTPKRIPAFDNNLQTFLERKIPCEFLVCYRGRKGIDPGFDLWLEETAKKEDVLGCLQDLYSRFGILPAPVLLILAQTQQFITLKKALPPEIRQKRKRHSSIKTLDATLKVIEIYDAPTLLLNGLLQKEEMEQEATAKSYLESLKGIIKMIRGRKESDVEMRFCAQTLTDFFRDVTGKPLREYVGSLLTGAFPNRWGFHDKSNLRLAALQRAKGPSSNARRWTLEEALALQNQDPDHKRFWRKQRPRIAEEKRKGLHDAIRTSKKREKFFKALDARERANQFQSSTSWKSSGRNSRSSSPRNS